MKKNVLIIGAGGVAQVIAHKCAQNNDVLGNINIASRTQDKCLQIVESIKRKKSLKIAGDIKTYQLDALKIETLVKLIKETKTNIIINAGSSFINMSVLRACINSNIAYIDTAIHEEPHKICETPPWYQNYEWRLLEECDKKSITAILGAGFDPGVVNAFSRLAKDEYFDKITDIDIIDVNAGKHNRYFATNFDPEINFREFTGVVYSWQKGKWNVNKMFEVSREYDLPIVGKQKVYLSGHDEIHSLFKNMNGADIRFWMGFSDHYINVFTILKNIGLLSEQPIRTAEGIEVAPLKIVKSALPDPASLAPEYNGKICIGCLINGINNGKSREIFLYNISDHKKAYQETESQGVSYTAGIPPVAAAMLVAQGIWDVGKMVNVEELPPKPFLATLHKMGLSTSIRENNKDKILQLS
ncbi:saccharopine dehydrogenase family protein [Candidatus Liberibacter americanus]|uniref:Saccharopine dehydrogenase n=1 Tax=Candidatus Liberibacter americanus str. Sao Paulo TaxID=1261131 RepID=U6B3F4_9HYPH|nr:saccharopine dehydrogenase family protein [Candidatus Liberibacter americanus]AHA27589.1 Saccharopine dehydrogenase [Candidatus Liberibacter americanus str. Sao Paulo]EMS36450.1 saccharopine dehydrogenase [Candidatus Liberibacter americanus PW_SP]